MAENTSPQVDSLIFPLDKHVRFDYNGRTRRGVVEKTTDNTIVLDQGDQEGVRSQHQQFTIASIQNLQYI